MLIALKPKAEWSNGGDLKELIARMKRKLSVIPGVNYEFTQPIEHFFNALITGSRADIAIKVFGEDLDLLHSKAMEIKGVVSQIPGASDINVEETKGMPQIVVDYNRRQLARYGVNISEVNELMKTAFNGSPAGVFMKEIENGMW